MEYASDYGLSSRSRGGRWAVVPDDKLLAGMLMDNAGIPSPRLLALYHPRRIVGHCALLRTPSEVERFLLQDAVYPLFSKPVVGIAAEDAMHVVGCDGRTLSLGDGTSLEIGDFVSRYDRHTDGVIFQELLEPHRDISQAFGPNLRTVRSPRCSRSRRRTTWQTISSCQETSVPRSTWTAAL